MAVMRKKRLWFFALVCAVLAATTAQPSLSETLDQIKCGGGGKTADEMIDSCDKIIAFGGTAHLSIAEALMLRGNHLFEKHEYGGAIEDFSRSIALDASPGTLTLFNRGLAYVAKGDDGRAMQDFDEQIRHMPQYQEAIYQRGMIWGRRHQFDLAVRDFDEVLRLYDYFHDKFCCQAILVKALYQRGLVRLVMLNFAGAFEDLSRVIEINFEELKAVLFRH
jgi:tetratricopeptide (TPR) repeat protein